MQWTSLILSDLLNRRRYGALFYVKNWGGGKTRYAETRKTSNTKYVDRKISFIVSYTNYSLRKYGIVYFFACVICLNINFFVIQLDKVPPGNDHLTTKLYAFSG